MGWRHLVAVLFLAVLAGGCWWMLRPLEPAVLTEAGVEEPTREEATDPAALAARALLEAPTTAARRVARGKIVGSVLRGGSPAGALVQVFERARGEPGGRVRDRPESQIPPAAGALQAPVATVSAGPDGAFELELPSPARYLLVARGEGTGRKSVVLLADGLRVQVRLELRGGPETLTGRARHADGRPFQGRISVEPTGAETGEETDGLDSVATEPDGRFTVAGLEAGLHSVSAFVPGRWRAWARPVGIPFSGEFEFVVDEGMREVSGRVVEAKDGRGITGALVSVQGYRQGDLASFHARAVSEADGRFTVIEPGWQSSWRVEAVGFAPLSTWRRRAPEGAALELRLERLARLSGRVTSQADGTPVAGVTVFAVPPNDVSRTAEGVTDAEGRYRIEDAPPGDVTVFAWGAGWCTPELALVSSRGFNPLAVTLLPEGVATADLVVTKAARATGRVIDATEVGVAGARVSAAPQMPGGSRNWGYPWLNEVLAVATDAEGRFAMDTLMPGQSYIFATVAPDASPALSLPMRAELATPLVVELRLAPARWVEVTVVLQGEKTPVAGVSVQGYRQEPEGNWTSFGPATTGAGGLARLGPAPSGPFQLWAWGEGHQMTDEHIVGGPEGSTAAVQTTVEVSRTTYVAGSVRYASGEAAEGVVVRVKGTNFESTEGIGADGAFQVEYSGTDDTVELSVLEDWESEKAIYETRAKPGARGLVLTVPGSLPPKLAVRVLDPLGRPVPTGMALLKEGSSSNWGSFLDGIATFATPKEVAHLLVHSPSTQGGTRLPFGLLVAGPIDAKALEFEVKLLPEVPLEGTVRTADGQPVRGVSVRARPKGLPPPFEDWREEVSVARTDEVGHFRLGGLGQGLYELRVDAADRAGRTEPVEAQAGRNDVEIVLGVGLEVALRVVDGAGLPVPGATVGVSGGGTRRTAADCDASGVARLRGLDANSRYSLWAAPPPGRKDLLRMSQENWSPRDETIALSRGFSVDGVVRDRQGHPVAGALVNRLQGSDVAQQVRSGADGSFTLGSLAAGTVALAAQSADSKSRSRSTSVPAGTRDVVLVLEATTSLRVKISDWPALPDGYWATLYDEKDGTAVEWGQLDAAGLVTISSLLPDAKYTLFVVLEQDEGVPVRVAWRAGIEGGAGETTATLEPGLAVGVRLVLPAELESAEVVATDGVVSREASMEDATRGRVTGLHPGPWTLRATAKGPSGSFAAEAKAEAGGSVVLTLEPVR